MVDVSAAAGLKAERDVVLKAARLVMKTLADGREVSVLLAGDDSLRELNRRWRGMDKPTDVLSFPAKDTSHLGDVAISVETARRQAAEYGVEIEEELSRLLVHGILHLMGYDHVKGGAEAKKMKAKEAEVLLHLKKEGIF